MRRSLSRLRALCEAVATAYTKATAEADMATDDLTHMCLKEARAHLEKAHLYTMAAHALEVLSRYGDEP